MNSTGKIVLWGALLLALATSCNEKEKIPEDLLTPDEMASVLVGTELADALSSQKTVLSIDSAMATKKRFYRGVLEKHGLTREQFQHSFHYYEAHSGKMEEVYEMVLDSLSRLEMKVKKEGVNENRYDQLKKPEKTDSISHSDSLNRGKKAQNKSVTRPRE